MEDRLTDFNEIVQQATEISPRLRTVAEGYVPQSGKPRVKADLLQICSHGDIFFARLNLKSDHPKLGPVGIVRTSKLVRVDFERKELETLNTLYEFGDE